MAQHDYNIANQTGLEFRADLNDMAEAIVTQNSGPTEPTVTYAGMKWLDTSTSPPIEKRRNAANSAWETTLTEAGRAVAGASDAAAQLTAMGAQAALVSGTNIKTINGETVLGSGNIVISAESVPAGCVAHFAMSSAPTGWLKANGALVSRTTYAALFSAIGTTFGAGDGSTTFALPDLRGEFLRGWDDGRGVDSGRVFGSAQAGTDHVNVSTNGTPAIVTNTSVWPTNVDAWGANANRSYMGGMTTDASQNAQTYKSRPRNVALLACIKF